MRVEWVKSHARYQRWSEEVLLVIEEMRRVIFYLEWKADWWQQQTRRRSNAGENTARDDVQSGIEAYSHRQSQMLRSIAKSFASLWYPILTEANLPTNWPTEYLEHAKKYPRTLRKYGGRRRKPAASDRLSDKSDSEDEDDSEDSDGLSEDDEDVSPYR